MVGRRGYEGHSIPLAANYDFFFASVGFEIIESEIRKIMLGKILNLCGEMCYY